MEKQIECDYPQQDFAQVWGDRVQQNMIVPILKLFITNDIPNNQRRHSSVF